jgi:hypothetical protein
MLRIALLVLALAACGGGGQSPTDGANPNDGRNPTGDGPLPGSCGTDGSGTVSGTIGGVEVAPVLRANQITVGGAGTGIILDEVGGQCGMAGETGEHLVLIFCEPPTVGTHTVGTEQQFMCPGTLAAGLIEQDGGGDFAEATGGSITITSADGSCTTGTFSVDLTPDVGSPGTLTGSFAAVVCP